MPFKIVQTVEKRGLELTVVPATWEKTGTLFWPNNCPASLLNALLKDEASKPDPSWRRISCTLKRNGFLTAEDAENELQQMAMVSDSDGAPPTSVIKRVQKNSLQIRDFTDFFEDVPTVSENVKQTNQDCEYQYIFPLETGPVSPSVVNIMPKPSQPQHIEFTQPTALMENSKVRQPVVEVEESFGEQNDIVSVPAGNIRRLEALMMQQVTAVNEMKVALEKVLKCMEERNVQTSNTSTLGTSFDTSFDSSQFSFNILEAPEDLTFLEERLHDEKFKAWLLKHLEPICGASGQSDGRNCAYRLVDHIFSRQLLANCSLLGGSKRSSTSPNCGIKLHNNVYEFFFKLIRKADSTFTLEKQDKFFEVILKNKKARLVALNASHPTLKASKRKQRPKNLIYAKRSAEMLFENNKENQPTNNNVSLNPEECIEVEVLPSFCNYEEIDDEETIA